MNTPKHTPGPWIVDDRHIHRQDGLTYSDPYDPETDLIVMVDTDCHPNGLLNDTDKANLRLIALAPEMLEALREATELLTVAYQASKTGSELWSKYPATYNKARAILAKLDNQ